MKKRLLLVDDHMLFLEGLQYLLSLNGIEVLGMACDGNDALIKARELKPDIILMDIYMQNCNGLKALKAIKEELPDIKIVMLTTSEAEEDILLALRYGASGYLLKDTDAQVLIKLLNDLEEGAMPISAGMAARIIADFNTSLSNGVQTQNITDCDKVYNKELTDDMSVDGELDKSGLTIRQKQILEMVAMGITYKEVGNRLGLSERTVKYHMGRLIDRLHLKNRAQVIQYAAREGIIQEEQ